MSDGRATQDRLARGLAAFALALAGIALILAVRAFSLVEESSDRIRELTHSLDAALAVQRHQEDGAVRAPPPRLDREE